MAALRLPKKGACSGPDPQRKRHEVDADKNGTSLGLYLDAATPGEISLVAATLQRTSQADSINGSSPTKDMTAIHCERRLMRAVSNRSFLLRSGIRMPRPKTDVNSGDTNTALSSSEPLRGSAGSDAPSSDRNAASPRIKASFTLRVHYSLSGHY